MIRRAFAIAAVTAAVWVGPASAQTVYTGVQPPAVGTIDPGVPGPSPAPGAVLGSSSAQLQAVQATQGNQSGLAFTGLDVMSLIALGGGAIAVGTVLKRRAHA